MSELGAFLATHNLSELAGILTDCGIDRIADLMELDAADLLSLGVPVELCAALLGALGKDPGEAGAAPGAPEAYAMPSSAWSYARQPSAAQAHLDSSAAAAASLSPSAPRLERKTVVRRRVWIICPPRASP